MNSYDIVKTFGNIKLAWNALESKEKFLVQVRMVSKCGGWSDAKNRMQEDCRRCPCRLVESLSKLYGDDSVHTALRIYIEWFLSNHTICWNLSRGWIFQFPSQPLARSNLLPSKLAGLTFSSALFLFFYVSHLHSKNVLYLVFDCRCPSTDPNESSRAKLSLSLWMARTDAQHNLETSLTRFAILSALPKI